MTHRIPAPDDLRHGTQDPPQHPARWYRATWARWLPAERAAGLDRLPDRVGREQVTEVARRAPGSESAALDAFVASMVWGYGPVGYGAWRTARILEENAATVGGCVRAVAVAARDDGPEAAFRTLAGRPPKHLGLAFGTKYLYFCTRAHRDRWGDRTAPVLDQVVRRWFAARAGVPLEDSWSVRNYDRYLTLLGEWAEELEIPADRVEEIVFERQAARDRRRTGAARQGATVPGGDGDGLDALDALRVVLVGLGRSDEAAEHLDALAEIIGRT